MQCFQQLPAASVFPGFRFHTLLSFLFVVFSLCFVSCFHLPWLLAALCCVSAVLNLVGLDRPAGAGAFGVQDLSYCQGNAEGPLCAEEQSWHWVNDSRLLSLDMECYLSFCSHYTLWFRGLGFSSQLSR